MVIFKEYRPIRHTQKSNPNTPQVFLEAHASTRDQVHLLVFGRVSLNRYDAKFLQDLSNKYLDKNRPLSEGQNELWEKIIHKYRKQLKKQGVAYKDILELEWTNGIRTREELAAQTSLDIIQVYENSSGDPTPTISMSFNFDKKTIDEVRALVHDDAHAWLKRGDPHGRSWGNNVKYDFKWHPEIGEWRGKFDPHLFRSLVALAKHKKIRIGANAHALLKMQEERLGQPTDWRTQARIVHGRVYVNCISDSLNTALAKADPELLIVPSVLNLEHLYNEFGVSPTPSLDARVRMLMAQGPQAEEGEAYQLTGDEDMVALINYLDATQRRAIINISTGKFDTSIVSRYINEVDLGRNEGVLRRFRKPTPKHALVSSFGHHEAAGILDGVYDTVITDVPYSVFFTVTRGLEEMRKKLKKYIHIVDTSNNPNKG